MAELVVDELFYFDLVQFSTGAPSYDAKNLAASSGSADPEWESIDTHEVDWSEEPISGKIVRANDYHFIVSIGLLVTVF